MSEVINLQHGAGGAVASKLLEEVILPAFSNSYLDKLTDGALLEPIQGRIVMATDSHVLTPRILPGASLGKLAFCGTVNDLAVMGARPLYLSLALIMEEGLEIAELKLHLQHMATLSKQFGIPIVTGDTKVVERGKGDGLYMSVTGVGVIENEQASSRVEQIAPGDHIIINGPIGNHEMAVLCARENIKFESELRSDCCALHELTLALWSSFPQVKCMRDLTRGGLSAACNELAQLSQLEFELDEKEIKVDPAVNAISELMGLDPLGMANEGKFILFVRPRLSLDVLSLMHQSTHGRQARVIGEVHAGHKGLVRSKTQLGGSRIIPMPLGEQMPRIC